MEILALFYEAWDLLTVGVVISTTLVLGFIVFFGNTKSATHRMFLGFSLFVAIWGTLNYLSYQPIATAQAFTILRFTLFAVTWMTFFFLLFASSFPKEKIGLPKIVLWILSAWTAIVSFLTLTPFVLEAVETISSEGTITSATNGPAIPIFGMTTLLYTVVGTGLLLWKTLRTDKEHKDRFIWITIGVLIMFFSLVASNFILPVIFNNTLLLPLAALFVFPFIAFTSYAVIKYHFLNIRVIRVEIFVVALLLITLIRLVQARTFDEILLQLISFIGLVIVSILILRSVLREVEQREELEVLTKSLAVANSKLKRLDAAKSEFLSIASHQLRTPLTAIKGYVSMILEGTYGKPSEKLQRPLTNVYDSNERLIRLVNDLLSLSRIESGKIEMEWEKVEIQDIIKSVIQELNIKAAQKNLKLVYQESKANIPPIKVDRAKIRNVALNIIDNAIKYTDTGSITASIVLEPEKNPKNLIVRFKDTGEGMNKEELEKLFQSFTRGSAGVKNFTEGAGLGLYIAKQFVEMHNGTIKAESEGKGKGSSFLIQLPLR